MKLLTFIKDNHFALGLLSPEGVVDIEAALNQVNYSAKSTVPTEIHQVIAGGADAAKQLADFTQRAMQEKNKSAFIMAEKSLIFGPCVTHPGKIFCIGLNYRKHAEETNAAIPEYPVVFSKFSNALAGHLQQVPVPQSSKKVDYEAELAIVIGKKAKQVSKAAALSYVFGYCNANDISARDLQRRTSQWLLGKSCDKFCPVGPYLVTADEIADPNHLAIQCRVNGELRQNSNTADMIFPCDEIVSYLSQHMTLEPGDIILTGTPQGVMFGYPPEKQVYLKAGDVTTIQIEKLGCLTNHFVLEG